MSSNDDHPARPAGRTERTGRTGLRAFVGVCVVFGVAFLIASWVGGHPALGVGCLALMLVFAAIVALARRRSETVRGLVDQRDERISGIDLRATAMVAPVLVVALTIGALVELAHGRSGDPYGWLTALAGVTYLTGVVVGRLRH